MGRSRFARVAGVVLLAAGALVACSTAAATDRAESAGPMVTVTRTSTVAPAASPSAVADSSAMTGTVTMTPSSGASGHTVTAGSPGETSAVGTGRSTQPPSPATRTTTSGSAQANTTADSGSASATTAVEPTGQFTLALAGDVNFAERTADLLAADPDTALQQAAGQLDKADITMVNLETAITTGGTPAPKQFHFRAPATALQALAAGGVDVATMANNHAVDYGNAGLADTLAAIADSPIPVIGIGRNAKVAYAPYTVTVNGVRLAIIAASQVQDWTLATHTATADSRGIANAHSDRLVAAVRAAAAKADVVVVYLHWGIEYDSCPSSAQRSLAATLSKAGAAAVVGTHAHVLQGAGWASDGTYVAYGLGNYYWWRSFGNLQDDNGVLTLTFRDDRVVAADFLATHLDDRGVPMVATGRQQQRIEQEWQHVRACADLAGAPPAR